MSNQLSTVQSYRLLLNDNCLTESLKPLLVGKQYFNLQCGNIADISSTIFVTCEV